MSSRAHTVLLVDDEAMIRIALAEYLEDCGFAVIQAGDSDEAISVLCQPSITVDLVFTDVRMPEQMDGIGLARWVFENKPNIPIIIASGQVAKDAAASDLCGAESIGKPFGYQEATDKIRAAINRCPANSN